MTIFESILLLAVTACVIITAFGVLVIKKILKEIADKQYANGETLSDIRGDTVDIFQELNNIEDNILDDLRDIRIADKCISDLAINVKGNYNTLEQQQEDIGYIKMRINHILELMHPAHEVINQPPCYAPKGICTNPQMDCIGCPKRGTGGTWSTNIVKED